MNIRYKPANILALILSMIFVFTALSGCSDIDKTDGLTDSGSLAEYNDRFEDKTTPDLSQLELPLPDAMPQFVSEAALTPEKTESTKENTIQDMEELASYVENAYLSFSESEKKQRAQAEAKLPATATTQESAYSNPIDEYFFSCMRDAGCEAELRWYQDTYRGVWKSEFYNIVQWAAEMYTYQQDLDVLNNYISNVEQQITNMMELVLAALRAEHDLPPDASSADYTGNGTRSWLNQLTGEIYRDAGMRLIENIHYHGSYVFLDVDYSKESYE